MIPRDEEMERIDKVAIPLTYCVVAIMCVLVAVFLVVFGMVFLMLAQTY